MSKSNSEKPSIFSRVSGRIGDYFTREIVTLNIEDTDLRFMVSTDKQVIRWGSIPLEPGTVRDGLVLNHRALSNAIDELFSSQRLNKRKVTISLSGFQSVHRTIELPKMARSLLSQAMITEAKQTMPVTLEKLYLSWQKIGKGKKIQRFFLVGTPRNLLDAEVKCLDRSGIKPLAMNLKPLALAKMVDQNEALIIDIESESCEIILIADGIPVLMRSIPMHLEYSPSDRVQFILQEFERTLGYFESNYPDITLNKDTPLFLTGKLAGEGDLAQMIAAGVGFNVKTLVSSMVYPGDFPMAQYAGNIGLALKNLSRKRSTGQNGFLITDIDIIPEEYLPKNLTSKQALSVCGILIAIAIIFPLYQMEHSAGNKLSQLKSENASLQRTINAQQSRITEAQQLQAAITNTITTKQKLVSILDDFQQIGEQRQRAYYLLCLAVKHTPEGILPNEAELFSLSEANGTLDLLGQAMSYEVALEYADALRKTEGFSNVEVRSLTTADGKGAAVKFDIGLEWK
jgi:hypothetical protein